MWYNCICIIMNENETKNKNHHEPRELNVHKVLAHSYTVYFILFLTGVYLDLVFSTRGGFLSDLWRGSIAGKIFTNPIMVSVGVALIIFASILIFWAQKTGRELRKVKEVKTEHFCRGPYCYSRIPTQWGLFFLILGFGIIANAFFVVLFTVISFFIFKFVFLGKHDRILIEKYGTAYLDYKKSVKF